MTRMISRRLALAALGGMAVAFATAIPGEMSRAGEALARTGGVTVMDPRAVFEKVKAGEVMLIDVRTPQEWAQTGVPEGAHPIELAPTFLAKLNALTGGDKNRPLAFICATGARSNYVATELAKRGWTHVIDVAGGLFGGPRGKGWIAAGLPMQKLKKN